MIRRLKALLPGLARIRGDVGGEKEMSFNRLVFALVFAIYLPTLGRGIADEAFVTLAIWSLAALLIFLHIRIAPGAHPTPRRALALVLDMGVLTWFLHIGGAISAPFYPVYIWVALGNGFRFGRPWLLAAMAAFFAGFGWVAVSTPYWTAQPYLAAGLFLGPAILGLYANTLIHKLSQARQQAEQANAAKSLFLASVSHDLRTPLHAIIGTGSLLRGTALDADQQEMARTMEDAAQTLLSRIGGILDFSRIEAGGIQVRADRFHLGQLLAEVRRLLAVQAREKGLSLSVHAAAGTPAQVVCDRAHLRDVLLNLVGNAVKFTATGHVVLAVSGADAGSAGPMLRFEVSDTGIGVEPAAARRIFDQFVQADGTILNRFGGTGLGLAICRGLVRAMGGEIGVTSTPGQGSTFWFTIRLGAAPGAGDTAPAPLAARLLTTAPARAAPLGATLRGLGATVTQEDVAPERLAAMLGEAAWLAPEHLLVCGPGASPRTDAGGTGPAPGGREAVLMAFVPEATRHALPPEAIRRHVLTVLPVAVGAADLRSALGFAQALLPAAPAPARPASPEAKRPPGAAAPEVGQDRVLVADDNAVNRRVLQRMLERAGFAVTTASDGQEALDRLEDGDVAVALMDVNMPVLDGIEATKLHRFIALGGPHLPIIGLTADAAPETARRCLDAGMDFVLTKPVDEAVLVETIRDQLAGAAPVQPPPLPAAEEPAAPPPVLSADVLERLVQLGGIEFLAEVADDFAMDARGALAQAEAALRDDDALRFRAAAHALRSTAANIGATRLRGLAGAAELVRVGTFAADGPAHLGVLMAEVDTVCAQLAAMSQ